MDNTAASVSDGDLRVFAIRFFSLGYPLPLPQRAGLVFCDNNDPKGLLETLDFSDNNAG
jgi:hypothetical protein